MTMRWFEGFEVRKNAAAFTQAYSQLTFGNGSIDTGRLHGSCLKNVGGTGTVFTTPGLVAGDVWCVGLAYRRDDTAATTHELVSIYDGASTRQITLATFVSGGRLKIQVYTDAPGGSHTWTASGDWALSQWVYLEFKVTVAPATSGSFEVRLNAATILTQSSVNTANGGTSTADRVRFVAEGSASLPVYLDDLYVCDDAGSANNNFKGDQVIEGILPSGAGTTTQWTPSAGANYAAVDDPDGPDDDATYVATASNGVTDTYAFGDLAYITGGINAVMVAFNARILTAGARTLRVVTRSGGTDYEGSDQSINNTGFQERQQIWETNPDTAAAWTASGVNAAEFGIKATA